MARPIKEGLDYFPLDVVMEDDVELLEAECGLVGFAIFVKIYQKIYQNSFYIKWGEDNALLFARKINSTLTKVNEVINVCLKRDLLDKTMYKQHKILTSNGIQKRFFKIYNDARRKGLKVREDYLLVNAELTGVNVELTQVKTESSTQSKVKESREDKNIKPSESEKKFDPRKEYSDQFEKLYYSYPKRGGKRQGQINFHKHLKKHGYDNLKKALENYIEAMEILGTQIKYYDKFSNFYGQKATFEDYLPGEYEKPKKPKGSKKKNSFHDMQSGKDYSEDELNAQLGLS